MKFAKLAAAGLLLLAACATRPSDEEKLARIDTVVVIYAENHSFDNLYGLFPGADGIANAAPETTVQRDHDGTPLASLRVWGSDGKPDPAFPALPNRPFQINAPPINRGLDQLVPGPTHLYYHSIEQIDGGRNDRFAAMSSVGGWVMGHYDGSSMRLWQWAKEYTLADHFFMGAFGGSFLNHQYLVCACAPEFKDAPAGMRVQLDASNKLLRQPDSPSASEGPVKLASANGGQVTPDGYAVNTSQPPYQPSGIPPASGGNLDLADPAGSRSWGRPIPPQQTKTIGDTLSAKNVSWAWYSGGWNQALADGRHPPAEKRTFIYSREGGSQNFQPHHQPFNYFARYAPGTPERALHFRDGEDLLRDIDTGTLPQVSFYKPVGKLTQHPSYTDVASGDAHIADLLERLRRSPQWPRMLVIVTYDENGGYWDHVPPPSGPGWGDRWGPATRVPALIVSPLARKGAIDPTPYDTGSILKLITRRFALEPLPGVREKVGDLSNALE
jgi:acid phosphatase